MTDLCASGRHDLIPSTSTPGRVDCSRHWCEYHHHFKFVGGTEGFVITECDCTP